LTINTSENLTKATYQGLSLFKNLTI